MRDFLGRRMFSEPVQEEDKKAYEEMARQIAEAGGSLSFCIVIKEDGWSADCNEFPQIITGGDSPDPREEEINRAIIDAVKTAFNVPIQALNFDGIESKLNINVKTVQERNLVLS
jgi:hypothetical protein